MPGNTFGLLFRVTTAGESHGPGNVCLIDGVPPGMELRCLIVFRNSHSLSEFMNFGPEFEIAAA